MFPEKIIFSTYTQNSDQGTIFYEDYAKENVHDK